MNITHVILYAIVPIIVVMLVGYIAGKRGSFSGEDSKKFNKGSKFSSQINRFGSEDRKSKDKNFRDYRKNQSFDNRERDDDDNFLEGEDVERNIPGRNFPGKNNFSSRGDKRDDRGGFQRRNDRDDRGGFQRRNDRDDRGGFQRRNDRDDDRKPFNKTPKFKTVNPQQPKIPESQSQVLNPVHFRQRKNRGETEETES